MAPRKPTDPALDFSKLLEEPLWKAMSLLKCADKERINGISTIMMALANPRIEEEEVTKIADEVLKMSAKTLFGKYMPGLEVIPNAK